MIRLPERLSLLLALAMLAGASPALAQPTGEIPSVFDGVGIEEQLGETLPLNTRFRNEAGEEVTLGAYFDGERPVVLNLVYHECPMLCSLLLTEFTKTLAEMEWQPGAEFDVITVSFSATEDPDIASRAKDRYLGQLGNPDAGAGWHFLTGEQESIETLADALGFSYKWVESSQEFAHPAALMFASGEGVITRYIHGMGYEPGDVRKAVVEASEGRVGTAVDRIFLYCYRYDAEANSYIIHAQNLMKLGGLLTLLLLGAGLYLFWRRERRSLEPAVQA